MPKKLEEEQQEAIVKFLFKTNQDTFLSEWDMDQNQFGRRLQANNKRLEEAGIVIENGGWFRIRFAMYINSDVHISIVESERTKDPRKKGLKSLPIAKPLPKLEQEQQTALVLCWNRNNCDTFMVEWDNEHFGRRFQANNRVLMQTGIGQLQMGRWYNIGFTSKSATHISIAECQQLLETPLETRVIDQIVQLKVPVERIADTDSFQSVPGEISVLEVPEELHDHEAFTAWCQLNSKLVDGQNALNFVELDMDLPRTEQKVEVQQQMVSNSSSNDLEDKPTSSKAQCKQNSDINNNTSIENQYQPRIPEKKVTGANCEPLVATRVFGQSDQQGLNLVPKDLANGNQQHAPSYNSSFPFNRSTSSYSNDNFQQQQQRIHEKKVTGANCEPLAATRVFGQGNQQSLPKATSFNSIPNGVAGENQRQQRYQRVPGTGANLEPLATHRFSSSSASNYDKSTMSSTKPFGNPTPQREHRPTLQEAEEEVAIPEDMPFGIIQNAQRGQCRFELAEEGTMAVRIFGPDTLSVKECAKRLKEARNQFINTRKQTNAFLDACVQQFWQKVSQMEAAKAEKSSAHVPDMNQPVPVDEADKLDDDSVEFVKEFQGCYQDQPFENHLPELEQLFNVRIKLNSSRSMVTLRGKRDNCESCWQHIQLLLIPERVEQNGNLKSQTSQHATSSSAKHEENPALN